MVFYAVLCCPTEVYTLLLVQKDEPGPPYGPGMGVGRTCRLWDNMPVNLDSALTDGTSSPTSSPTLSTESYSFFLFGSLSIS